MEADGGAPDGGGDDPGVADGEDGDEAVEKEALRAPGDGFQHGLGLA